MFNGYITKYAYTHSRPPPTYVHMPHRQLSGCTSHIQIRLSAIYTGSLEGDLNDRNSITGQKKKHVVFNVTVGFSNHLANPVYQQIFFRLLFNPHAHGVIGIVNPAQSQLTAQFCLQQM